MTKLKRIIDGLLMVFSIILLGVGCGVLAFLVAEISSQLAIVVLFLVALVIAYTVCKFVR